MGHIQATGFYMIHQLYTAIKYGLLYNWYAVTDARLICSAGWHVPVKAEWDTLNTYLGGDAIAGGKLKETGTTYWNSPNTGATNEVGFNARGASYRLANDGTFALLKDTSFIMATDRYLGVWYYYLPLSCNNDDDSILFALPRTGSSIRLIKDSTDLEIGETGTYTGNDGRVYRTICIGTQEWLADNLAETKYRNGDTIPEVTNNAAWAALTTGALCAYDNDWDNV